MSSVEAGPSYFKGSPASSPAGSMAAPRTGSAEPAERASRPFSAFFSGCCRRSKLL